MVPPASLGDAHWYPLLKCADTTSGHMFPHNTASLPWLYTLYVQTGSQLMCGTCRTSQVSENTSGYPRLTCFVFFFTLPTSKALLDPEFPKICPGTSHGTLKPVKKKLPCFSISPGNIRLCLTLPLLRLLLDLHISVFSSHSDQTLMETTQGRMKSFSLTL